LVHLPVDRVAVDGSLLFGDLLGRFGSDDADTSGLGVELGGVVDLERDVGDFEGTGIPAEEVLGEGGLDAAEGEGDVGPGLISY
jgi:hypothetical protein